MMDVVFSYELTNTDDLHLAGKYFRYFHKTPKCESQYVKSHPREYDRCHINSNTVTEQSSPNPNNESKLKLENTPTSDNNTKIKNNYQYFSDSELCKMPSEFENSSMKNSFSMSSLQPSSRIRLEQSLQATNSATTVLPNRAYNSLTHKLRKRNPEQDCWRNSWGHDDQKDEFWTSFESNYQYLMNNNLIDSCKEAKNDLNTSPSQDWTYSHFKQQFLDLDSWLNSIQKTIYAVEDNITVQNLRLSQIEEMKRKNYQRKNFVSQSSRLVTQYPEYKDEILDCVSQLNTKWDQLTQTMSPKRNISGDCFNLGIDVHCELHCLSKWIRTMEKKIEPLNFRRKWSLMQLKLKAKEHEIVQRDVESHGKIVLSVVKLCEKHSQNNDSQVNDALNGGVKGESALRKAQRWERRWHLLYLKCLEWQYYIEEQINSLSTENCDDTSAESDDEQPKSKLRRLNGYVTDQNTLLSSLKKNEDSDVEGLMDTGNSVLSVLNERLTATNAVSCNSSVQNEVDMLDSEQQHNSSPLQPQSCVDVPLNNNYRDALRKLSIETLSKMIPPEFAMYNTTDVSARNVGVYYIPHEDTDPEQEKKTDKLSSDEMRSQEETSDDEWTYKNLENDSMDTDACSPEMLTKNDHSDTVIGSSEDLRNLSKKVLDSVKLEPDSIQRLVDQADELVHTTPKKTNSRKKVSPSTSQKVRHNEQVREWLRKCHQNGDYSTTTSVGDSCDASGEYTTEDDDQYERRSSCGQTMTVIGSQDNGIDVPPINEFASIMETPKVVLRNKSGPKKSRPFSTSELTCRSHGKLSSMQWVSESALHKMLSLKDTQCTLSSSTIEECTMQTLEGSGCSMNSLRRRKFKHRRRSNLGRKGHSGSADSLSSLAYQETAARRFYRSPVRLSSHYIKSDTFSEPTAMRQRLSSVERAIASDPANCLHNSTSGTETEEELTRNKKWLIRKKLLSLPAFRLGQQFGTVTRRDCNVALSATSAEEQMSSFSENAWDDFQERYVSEAYSEEPVDSDQVKKLTEFGDDYRNYIDSHSDCASDFIRRSRALFGHSTLIAGNESSPPDSDSELEDVRKLLQRSHAQLCCAEQLFAKQTAKPVSCLNLSESDFADLRNTCRENVRCLRVLLDRIETDGILFMPQQVADIKSMLDKWENLECKTDEVERRCLLQRDILELRKKLQDVSVKMPNMAFQIEDRFQLEKNIQILKVELDVLEDKKSLISDYNIKAHRLLNDSKYSTVSLKDDINELYHVWEETHQKVSHQLQTLQQALLAWRNFDMHMLELKTVLREDHTALNVLDKALKHEEYVGNVASTVQNIVKYLPDKHHENLIKADSNRMTSLDTEHVDSMSNLLTNTLNVEASFSDSGISDSGSEQDLCEREKRLALLRKLARHLEAVLAPGSEALLSIMKKIDEAEEEIRELQQTCRIIIKTGYMERNEREFFKKEKLFRENFQKTNKIERRTSPGDPGSDPDKGRSVFWRVLRAALPFHLAIVVLLCVACLLEPNCCDVINNLNLSLSPQLRYLSGPPPT